MRELSIYEIEDVSAGKFKWHINPYQAVFGCVAAFLAGGPVGLGYAIGAAIAAQGAGNLHQMYVDEFGNVQQR